MFIDIVYLFYSILLYGKIDMKGNRSSDLNVETCS